MLKNLLVLSLLVLLALTQSQRLDSEVNFDGQYTPSLNQYLISTAKVIIRGNTIRLEGVCKTNTHSTFKAYSSGKIKIERFEGNFKTCFNYFDASYEYGLSDAASWEYQGQKLIFKNAKGRTTIDMVKTKPPGGNPVSFAGKYQSSTQKGLIITFTDSELIFNGKCKVSSPYRAYTDNKFFVEPFRRDNTRNCPESDATLGTLFGMSRVYTIKKDNSIAFKDSDNEIIFELKPQKRTPAPRIMKTESQVDSQRVIEKPIDKPVEKQVDKCANVKCSSGSVCSNGQCLRVSTANTNLSADKCLSVKCSSGAKCDKGKCVPDIQNIQLDNAYSQSNNWDQPENNFAQPNNNWGQSNNNLNQFGQNQRFSF